MARGKTDPEALRRRLVEAGAVGEDLERFDRLDARRRFLGQAAGIGLAGAFGAGLGAAARGLFARGLIPRAWAADVPAAAAAVPGKPGMIVHAGLPLTGEFPPHLLDDPVTPTARHFVRNNGLVPERAANRDPQGWRLTIDGLVHRPLELSVDDLRRLPAATLPLLVECAGNGRAFFEPPVRGTPWRWGAVGCSRWTGVRLRDLLAQAGLAEGASYTAHRGEDPPLGKEAPFSRGIPLAKALEEHTLVAYAMNGADLEPLHGYPVRLVVPGWAGSASQKWLTRITVLDHEHDSDKMTGYSYRVPAYPVVPGSRPPPEDMVVVTSWPVKSVITHPAEGARLETATLSVVRGHAWAGEGRVTKVLVSIDYGVRWVEAVLSPPAGRYAWYGWTAPVSFPGRGYYEVWARAFDGEGGAQPFRQPWNPRGYLGNVVHRVPVQVGP
ncbi:MAG: sulfite oxidase [Deferrisomatales bacterium]